MTESMPTIVADAALLDDLELVRAGLVEHTELTLPRAVLVQDAEGVLVAENDADGLPSWRGARSAWPFQSSLLTDVEVPRPAALVNSAAALGTLPKGTRTILVLASTDDDGAAHEIALVRAARAEAERRGCLMRVVPLGAQAPDRDRKLGLIRDALAAGGELVDRTDETEDAPAPARQGVVVLFTGLSGSGKSTIARALRNRLIEEHGIPVTLLDGDLVRRHLSSGLGFSPQDRQTNVLRIGWVAAEVARHGGVAIASPIAPDDGVRRQVQRMVEERGGRFVLIHVATPLKECERRDRKGLYARARAGEIPDFTGISSPYDEPASPDLRLDTTGADVADLVDRVLTILDLPRRHAHLQEHARLQEYV